GRARRGRGCRDGWGDVRTWEEGTCAEPAPRGPSRAHPESGRTGGRPRLPAWSVLLVVRGPWTRSAARARIAPPRRDVPMAHGRLGSMAAVSRSVRGGGDSIHAGSGSGDWC